MRIKRDLQINAMEKQFYIYILSNTNHSVFYVGMTNDLMRWMHEHRNKLVPGFTARYNISKLLYYEICNDPEVAIAGEKQVKDINRKKKMALILSKNPGMNDLYEELADT